MYCFLCSYTAFSISTFIDNTFPRRAGNEFSPSYHSFIRLIFQHKGSFLLHTQPLACIMHRYLLLSLSFRNGE
uniref:Uncharacterized protein n=1 Tax=Anguilla anguilla TaxID=7936 RepID=A0A0E9T6B9_ANGAN